MSRLPCYAQTDPLLEGSDLRPLTASGSIGLSANGYLASGIANRRAPSSIVATANLNFSLFGLSSGLNLLYSTDQSELRQNMNNLGFNTTWKWLTVQAGSVSPNFSKKGINGVTLRGGYVRANPGEWLLELSGGRTKRSIEQSTDPGFRQPAFERWSFAGKIGYGSDEGTHFYLSSHYSLDKSGSLENPGNLTPQENLTVTPDARIILLDGILSLESQVTLSAYTRDLNTPVVPLGGTGIPSFLDAVIQPHTSSRMNYAGQAEANLNLQTFSLGLGYERIQPGFISMGISRIRDDQRNIRISPSIQLFDNRLQLQSNVVLGRDNLLNTRLQTRRNTNVGTNVRFQLTELISINANHNILINDFSSDAQTDTLLRQEVALEQRQVSNTFTLQPTVTLQKERITHTVSLTGSYMMFTRELENPQQAGSGGLNFDTYISNLSYSITFPSGFSVNTTGNFLFNDSGRSENRTYGGNVGASYSLLERSLTLSLNGGFNQTLNETSPIGQNQAPTSFKSRQFMLNLTGNYRVSDKDTISLVLRGRSNNVLSGGRSSFSELEGTLNYRHRF